MTQQNQVMLSADTCILNREVDRLVSNLLSITGTVPADDFKQTAMHRLEELIPIDMGIWVSCRTSDLHVHNATLASISRTFPAPLLVTTLFVLADCLSGDHASQG